MTASGIHVIETQGTTDVVTALYGPNDVGTLITEDDDSGPGANSRIERDLTAGTYYVRVRHYSGSSTGSYAISVRSSAPQPGVQTIQVNGPAVQGTIATSNERDMYTFTAATSGMYTIRDCGQHGLLPYVIRSVTTRLPLSHRMMTAVRPPTPGSRSTWPRAPILPRSGITARPEPAPIAFRSEPEKGYIYVVSVVKTQYCRQS